MRLGIVQQNEVGEHLDGPIGDELIDKGVLEGIVPELQQQPSVKRVLGLDVAHARDPLPHLPEDALKDRFPPRRILSVTWVQSITGAVQGDPLQQAQAPNGSKLAIPFGQMSETEKFLYKNSWSM